MAPPAPDTLPESRIYTFIDGPREFALYFLEGQRLIRDLAVIHAVQGPGFEYFREVLLSIQPMIALLKHGEQLGFYVDSEAPYFRLKIETGHAGSCRCLLVPEGFSEFPESVHGVVRLLKLFPRNRPPYSSVIQLEGVPLRTIVNRVLTDSYQVNSTVMVATDADQSAMLHQLPPLAGREDYELSTAALAARRRDISESLDGLFRRALHEPEAVVEAFAEIGFRYLAVRPVEFRCSCSSEQIVHSAMLAVRGEFETLFEPGQSELEITCEYCKTVYRVTREEFERAARPM